MSPTLLATLAALTAIIAAFLSLVIGCAISYYLTRWKEKKEILEECSFYKISYEEFLKVQIEYRAFERELYDVIAREARRRRDKRVLDRYLNRKRRKALRKQNKHRYLKGRLKAVQARKTAQRHRMQEKLPKRNKRRKELSNGNAIHCNATDMFSRMSFQEYMLSTSKSPDPEVAQILNDHWEELI
jgi:hypothetical protein